jgi:L-seryl-tRNA(Ser) seleniumtransferase
LRVDIRDDRLRALPSVDRLATAVARAELAERRSAILAGEEHPGDRTGEPTVDDDLVAQARERLRPQLRRVLNATGVVLHTNLGRAPLAPQARAAIAEISSGYSNLELELTTGRRGSRGSQAERLVCELTGAESALVVNNGAAAVLLAVAALAGRGQEVLISRGELLEIGGGFRIPEIVGHAGARIVEVGTTNRTRAADYARAVRAVRAVGPETAAILRVHQSNFRMAGFVERPALAELVELGVPVIDDLGSGLLRDDPSIPGDEPAVRASVAGGATLVCFSGDKLLGGPQAGIIAGTATAVSRCRSHPLCRAVRAGKLSLAALEATLLLHRDPELAREQIPALAMLCADDDRLPARAERLAAAIGGEVVETRSPVGGGTLPLLELKGPAVALDPEPLTAAEFAARLRGGEPPVIARVRENRVLFDVRTLADTEIDGCIECVRTTVAGR